MSYSTSAEALKHIPKMADVPATDLDWNAVIAFIDNYIDNKLRGYYPVPFATSGSPAEALEPTVKMMARLLYAGWAQHIRYTEDDPTRMPNNIFWKEGRKMLQQIRAGIIKLDRTVVLPVSDPDDAYAKTEADSNTIDLRPVFNMGTELDWEEMVVDETTHERINPEDA